MSYILDALKKSEQERGNSSIPSVQTIHSSSLNYADKKTAWPYVLIAALLLNLAAILYYVAVKDNDDIPATTDESKDKVQQITTTETIANPIIEKSVDARPVKTNIGEHEKAFTSETDHMTTPRQKTVPEPKAQQTNNKTIVEFYDLPESIKQQLPAIIISAHVYSTNPAHRSIVINNNFLEEGEYILDDLVLYEITSDGAIFSYHETLFHHGVVSSWQ